MKQTMLVQILVTLTLATALTACSSSGRTVESPDAQSGARATLDGAEWVLISLNGGSLVTGSNITLAFAEGQAGGFAGCNHYGGPYMATSTGAITISEIAITAQACLEPEGVMQQEGAYQEALLSAAAYRMVDDHLEITNASGKTTLVFARRKELPMNPDDLLDTGWRLVSWSGNSLVEGSNITLVFHDEGLVGGFAGCRGYVASYEADGDDIGFPMMGMIGPSEHCSEALMLQESEYTTRLELATHYQLSARQLEISTARGEALVFEPLQEDASASLEKTAWTLAGFIEEKQVEEMSTPVLIPLDVLADTQITATFDDGMVSGSAGCNTYHAAYALDGDLITIEAIAVTEMACPEPAGVMEQEQRYLGFLRDVAVFSIAGSQLWLETDDGHMLVLAAMDLVNGPACATMMPETGGKDGTYTVADRQARHRQDDGDQEHS